MSVVGRDPTVQSSSLVSAMRSAEGLVGYFDRNDDSLSLSFFLIKMCQWVCRAGHMCFGTKSARLFVASFKRWFYYKCRNSFTSTDTTCSLLLSNAGQGQAWRYRYCFCSKPTLSIQGEIPMDMNTNDIL